MKARDAMSRALVFVAFVLSATPGCSKNQEEAAPPTRWIAVVPKGTTQEYWKSVHAGASKAASELGVKILWKGPPREGDVDSQVQLVDDFVTRGAAAIVLAPLDDRALVGACVDAKAAGIPVVVIDSNLEWDGMTSFVATDPRRDGALAAGRLGEVLGGKGKVAVLRLSEDAANSNEREAGFHESMKAKFPAVEVVPATEDPLAAHADLAGLFAPDESTTFAALRALEKSGRTGSVRLVGFGASEPLVDALESGKIRGLVVQNPFQMGRLAVKCAVDALDGRPVGPRLDPGSVLATPENLATPEVAVALHRGGAR